MDVRMRIFLLFVGSHLARRLFSSSQFFELLQLILQVYSILSVAKTLHTYIDHCVKMSSTPPYQKHGKCGHFMPQFNGHIFCFGCRAKCKGQDPCAQGANQTQCSQCAFLSEEQWRQLRENYAKKSAYREKQLQKSSSRSLRISVLPQRNRRL